MSFDKTRDIEWRARMKEKRRTLAAQRRAQLAADPRVQAMKQALKERQRAAYAKAKERRKALAAEQKQRRRDRALSVLSERDAALRKLLHPATDDKE